MRSSRSVMRILNFERLGGLRVLDQYPLGGELGLDLRNSEDASRLWALRSHHQGHYRAFDSCHPRWRYRDLTTWLLRLRPEGTIWRSVNWRRSPCWIGGRG